MSQIPPTSLTDELPGDIPEVVPYLSEARPRIPVFLFGLGVAAFVLYLVTFAINVHAENDFYREAWPPYRLLAAGHVIGFIQHSPAYVGSLILRAPFALVAALFDAGSRASYVVTALPCLCAPALLAAWLTPHRRVRTGARTPGMGSRIRPLDVFMLTPAAVVCLTGGHPEDILGATLCIAAVLLAQRGSARAAGLALGLALINKPWALIVPPLVFAVMPAGCRRPAFWTAGLITAGLMVPVMAIRLAGPGAGGPGLGSSAQGVFLVPQLLWWFGRNSWVAREGHVLLVLAGWLVTAAWWWLRVRGRREAPTAGSALIVLALVFFLRAALDPWDNVYYFTPFMLAVMTFEDSGGFPRLTWVYVILLTIIVPPEGLLRPLGANGHAAVFGVFALATIAWFGRRAFSPDRTRAEAVYAASAEPGSAA